MLFAHWFIITSSGLQMGKHFNLRQFALSCSGVSQTKNFQSYAARGDGNVKTIASGLGRVSTRIGQGFTVPITPVLPP